MSTERRLEASSPGTANGSIRWKIRPKCCVVAGVPPGRCLRLRPRHADAEPTEAPTATAPTPTLPRKPLLLKRA